jgi:quinol monooxygenase YgiN
MIVRIVKMTFMESRVDDFSTFVTSISPVIKSFKGCHYLEVLQDIHHKNIFFSYSHWESEIDLDNYRSSDFFKDTWSKVTQWFKVTPKAWSTERL